MKSFTFKQISQIEELLSFSDTYEISIQFWPEQTAVFISKDGIALESYGGSFDVIKAAINYLSKINRKKI